MRRIVSRYGLGRFIKENSSRWYPTINTENSIRVIDHMVERYWVICPYEGTHNGLGGEFGHIEMRKENGIMNLSSIQ